MSFSRTSSSKVPLARGSHIQAHTVSAPVIHTNAVSVVNRAGVAAGLFVVEEEGTSLGSFAALNFVGVDLTAQDAGLGNGTATVRLAQPTLAAVLAEDNDASDAQLVDLRAVTWSPLGIQVGTSTADATATAPSSLAIGTSATTATATNAVSLGHSATCKSGVDGVVVVGYNAYADTNSIVIGGGGIVGKSGCILVGYNTSAFDTNSIAIGNGVTGLKSGINIGDNWTGSGFTFCDLDVELGFWVRRVTSANNSVVMGHYARMGGNAFYPILIGGGTTVASGATTFSSGVVCIGGTISSGSSGRGPVSLYFQVVTIGSTNSGSSFYAAARGQSAIAIGSGTSGADGAQTGSPNAGAIALGTGAYSDGVNAVALGRDAVCAFDDSIALGSSVTARAANELACRGLRIIRTVFLAQISTLTLATFPMIDDDTVMIEAFVSERVEDGGSADLNKTRMYIFRDYHVSRTASTVTVNAGTAVTKADVGWTAGAATVTISASTTNVIVAVTSVPNGADREWGCVVQIRSAA